MTGFVRPEYAKASKSRAVLSFIVRKNIDPIDDDDPVSLREPTKMITLLDNKKITPVIIERTPIAIRYANSPFMVTPSLFREIMITDRMKQVHDDNDETIKAAAMSISVNSRSPSSDLDGLVNRLLPSEQRIAPRNRSTVPCGDKKCCVMKDNFDICNCNDDIAEINKDDDGNIEHVYRIPSCISRYQQLESMFFGKYNNVEAVENIEGMKALKVLDLNGSHIHTLDGIDDVPSIERLFLKGSRVKTIAGIERLQSLRSVDVRTPYLHDIVPAKHLKNLKHLFVAWDELKGDSLATAKEMMTKGIHVNLT